MCEFIRTMRSDIGTCLRMNSHLQNKNDFFASFALFADIVFKAFEKARSGCRLSDHHRFSRAFICIFGMNKAAAAYIPGCFKLEKSLPIV